MNAAVGKCEPWWLCIEGPNWKQAEPGVRDESGDHRASKTSKARRLKAEEKKK